MLSNTTYKFRMTIITIRYWKHYLITILGCSLSFSFFLAVQIRTAVNLDLNHLVKYDKMTAV